MRNYTALIPLTSVKWPLSLWSFTTSPHSLAKPYSLDRYKFWGTPGTKDSRERISDQTIGTANSRNITKEKVLVVLKEYTGPADPSDPTQPSTFKIARETLITAQRLLLDTGNLNMFHQSIGSLTLLDDYRRWRDRVFIDELAKAEAQGQSLLPKVVTTLQVIRPRIHKAVFLIQLQNILHKYNSSLFVPTFSKS